MREKVIHHSKRKRTWLAILASLIGLFLIYTFLIVQPSNNRDWEKGFEILPKITINGNNVSINDVRDYHYTPNNETQGYINRQVDVSKITKVWFLYEPFKIKPFTSFNGVAHTYFVFDFADQEPIAVSVEARRNKGEKYDAWVGMFNNYELIYVWGTEQDETVKRVIHENNPLYMFPLQISNQGAQKLFLQLAETTHQLESHPRFYNTLTSNCTNELAKTANLVKPNAIPFNSALFFPGYSVKELYKLGFLPTDMSEEQLMKKYYITDIIKQIYNKDNFSQELRNTLVP